MIKLLLSFRSLKPMMSTRFVSSFNSELKFIELSEPVKGVAHVQLNRPERKNALNIPLWKEIGKTFAYLHNEPTCRSIVISGKGNAFCSGIDIKEGITKVYQVSTDQTRDVSRKSFILSEMIKECQDNFTVIEKCRKPVIASIHGHCVGAAISMASCCDIRYSTSDSIFSIKEIDIGLAADVGILQRIQKIVGNDSWTREITYTARNFQGSEALEKGFVSRVFDTSEQCISSAIALAEEIASKSPISVQGSKLALNYARDHSIDESLEWMRNWNGSHLLTEDMLKIAESMMTKTKPLFSNL